MRGAVGKRDGEPKPAAAVSVATPESEAAPADSVDKAAAISEPPVATEEPALPAPTEGS